MSIIPGLQALIDKVPELASPRGFLRAALTFFGVMAVALTLLLVLDAVAPWLGLVLQLVMYGALYWLVRAVFQGREARMTYTDAFFGRLLPAGGINLASLLFIVMNGGGVTDPDQWGRLVPVFIGAVVAIYLFVTALLILVRSLQVAGIDTITCMYVYYPDEGRRIKTGLYGVMRHPIYAAIDRVALAFAMWNGTAYALLLAVIFIAVWHPVWIAVEEKELAGRLGDEYRDYSVRVPAVWPQGLSGEATLWQVLTGRVAEERAELPGESADTDDVPPPGA